MRSPETASRKAIRLRRLSLAATYAMLLAGAAIMVVPFAYSVLTSLKSPEQFASTDPLAFPAPVTSENYSALFSGDRDFTAWAHSAMSTTARPWISRLRSAV